MPEPTKRLHYFDGQFLRENDFTTEQEYHLQRLRSHNRLLHTPGIAEGLQVPDPPAGATAVTVNEGIAFDNQGRQIVLNNNTTVELDTFPDNHPVYITIAYDQQETDPTEETGVPGNTRWTETPLIERSTSAPSDPEAALVLARVNRTGTQVSTIDRSERLTAGVKGGDLELSSLTLTRPDIAPEQWLRVDLGGNKQAALHGSLQVEGNLTITGKVDGRDVAADGTKLDALVASSGSGLVSLDGVSNPGGNIDLNSANTITITPDDGNNRITIGESHSSNKSNPHSTTAAQVGALPISGGTLTGSLTVNGNLTANTLNLSGGQTINISNGILSFNERIRLRQPNASSPTAGLWCSSFDASYYGESDLAFIGIKSATEVGFWGNTGTPNWRLFVNTTSGNLTVTGNAFKPGGGSWGVSSDERLKKNIKPLEGALEQLLQLRGVVYEWKEPEKQGNLTGPQMGLLAQEVEKVFPDWIGVDPDDYKTLTIRGFEALVIEALKELKAENEALKKRCEALELQLAQHFPTTSTTSNTGQQPAQNRSPAVKSRKRSPK
jgi:hypothetical protein